MAKIIIIPHSGQNFDPSDFEVSVKKTADDSSYENYKKFRFKKDLDLNVHLEIGDILGIEYKGVAQKFTVNERAGEAFVHPIESNDLEDDIKLTIKGVSPGAEPFTIENDLDVNLKSFKQKEPFQIQINPAVGSPTKDQSFWEVINDHKIDFKHYRNFIDDILSSNLSKGDHRNNTDLTTQQHNHNGDDTDLPDYSRREKKADTKRLPFNRTEAYSLLKYATERYVDYVYNLENHADDDESEINGFNLNDYLGKDQIIPYYSLIKSKIKEYFRKDRGRKRGFLKGNTDVSLIELIWSYWHEEGMVNQTMLVIAKRFQNIKNGYRDPLGNFALDPLRPLNNILWGYIQDAQHRLTATRRNYEYTGEYDLCVLSTMKPGFNPADRRSKFLQSFHRLIYEATEYFLQADNTIIRPDGFKLLNALRDTHRILAEGAHNQFGDLPTVARIEMLIEQWILSRPEIREFLGSRLMLPYEEPWMDRVDSMKALQGWDNTSITFYRDLAVYGEKIILGIRYGDWTNVTKRDHATNWADAFRDAIQRYIHSYYTVTGIDLAAQNVNINSEEKFLLPGMLIRQKLIRDKAFSRRS